MTRLNLLFVFALDCFIRSFFFFLRKQLPKDRVAFVKMDNIGDFLLWQPFACVFNGAYVGDHRILVCSEDCRELATDLGFDQLFVINKRKFRSNCFYRLEIALKLRRLRVRELINFSWSRDFFTGDALTAFSCCQKAIGFKDPAKFPRAFWQNALADRCYATLVEVPAKNVFETSCYETLMDEMGISVDQKDISRPMAMFDFPVLQEELNFGGRYFILAPSATSNLRCWPKDRFALVAKWIIDVYQLTPIIIGAPSDEKLCNEVNRLCGGKGVVLAGKTSISEMVTVIAGSTILIGNESGPVHMAAMLGVSSICLLGGGHFERFLPYPEGGRSPHGVTKPVAVYKQAECYGCNWRCTEKLGEAGVAPCVESVTPDAVIEAIRSILKSPSDLTTINKSNHISH